MTSFLITCCHATCAIPEAQRELFKGAEDRVTSSEGWEPGALNLAQGLAMKLSTPLIYGEVSRLLVDLEEDGENVWSDISVKIPEVSRGRLYDRHQDKFHHQIEARLAEDFKRHDRTVHLDIHTAPIADGEILPEYAGAPVAEQLAKEVVSKIPGDEVDPKAIPITNPTPFIQWMLGHEEADKLGIVRITVSQSFFMRSVPLRWETIKKAIIEAISKASV